MCRQETWPPTPLFRVTGVSRLAVALGGARTTPSHGSLGKLRAEDSRLGRWPARRGGNPERSARRRGDHGRRPVAFSPLAGWDGAPSTSSKVDLTSSSFGRPRADIGRRDVRLAPEAGIDRRPNGTSRRVEAAPKLPTNSALGIETTRRYIAALCDAPSWATSVTIVVLRRPAPRSGSAEKFS